MRGFLILFLGVLPALALAKSAEDAWRGLVGEKFAGRPEFQYVQNDPNLPNVLIYGDSISIHYTQTVREQLDGKVNVYRIQENGGDSSSFIPKMTRMHDTMRSAALDDPWSFDWDVIHFNVGLHDLKFVKDGELDKENGTRVTSIGEYEQNLRDIVEYLRVLAPDAALIFATTTPVPEGARGRIVGDAARYNAAALKALAEDPQVRNNDLYTPTFENHSSWWAKPGNVHFNSDGRYAQGAAVAKAIGDALEGGAWQASWESLSKHEVPQWARDAKFGIYAHWGVYSVSGGWDRTEPNWGNYYILPYRGIYDLTGKDETFGLFEKNIGPVREGYGYIDLARQFRPADFDPEELADLIVKSGARYAGIAAMHHDGYAMWDSDVIRLDAGELGPERDLLGEILAAIEARGLKTMTSFHHARTFRHFEVVQKKLRSQPGHETVDLLDPALRDYYWYAGDENHFSDIRYRLTQEVINKYEPDVIWFDGGGGKFGTERILADYFNMADRAGKEVVVHNKGNFPEEFGVYSYENGFDRPAYVNWPWEDDTPSAADFNHWPWAKGMAYKKPPEVVTRLIDLVARNGGLLLSLNPRPDGKLDQEQIDLLLGVGAWLEQNGDAIFDTVPWKVFAEGNEGRLTYVVTGAKGQVGRPIQPDTRLFRSSDIRFTRNGETLYATTLGLPANGRVMIRSLATGTSISDTNRIESIQLLGHGKVWWERSAEALVIELPDKLPNDIALSFAITVEGKLDKSPPPVDSTRMKMPEQT
jgi:alpha-L-fucosidase